MGNEQTKNREKQTSNTDVQLKTFVKSLSNFKNKYQGQACLVSGLGPTIEQVTKSHRKNMKTIGVNFCQKWFVPDYLFISERLDINGTYEGSGKENAEIIIKTNKAPITFSRYLYPSKSDHVHYNFSSKGGGIAKAIESNKVDCHYTATTGAIYMALYMGFTRIGIIGFDIIGHTECETWFDEIDKTCKAYQAYAYEKGIEIVNLSEVSPLTAFQKYTLEEYCKYYG